jgi:hypothetical protein
VLSQENRGFVAGVVPSFVVPALPTLPPAPGPVMPPAFEPAAGGSPDPPAPRSPSMTPWHAGKDAVNPSTRNHERKPRDIWALLAGATKLSSRDRSG